MSKSHRLPRGRTRLSLSSSLVRLPTHSRKRLGAFSSLRERAGVPEVWLINPVERTVAIYRLEGIRYGRPTILKLNGHTQLAVLPQVIINWDPVLR